MRSEQEVQAKRREVEEKMEALPPEFNANSEYYQMLRVQDQMLRWILNQ